MVSIDPEGGDLIVKLGPGGVEISGNSAGLRDLAKWCLALAADDAALGSHCHFDAGISPLHEDSVGFFLERDDTIAS